MIAGSRWQENWRAVAPAGAVRIDVPRRRASRRAATVRVGSLPVGTSVVLVAATPGAARRCRRTAAAAGVAVEREYLAFASAAAPAYLVERDRGAIRLFARSVLVTPFRSLLALPADAALAVLRTAAAWRLVRALAPATVLVGTRS